MTRDRHQRSFARNRAAVIEQYVINGLSVRDLARRYSVGDEAVRNVLIAAHVTLRGRTPDNMPRPPVLSRQQSLSIQSRDRSEVESLSHGNELHVAAVRRALGGRGFPFITPVGGF